MTVKAGLLGDPVQHYDGHVGVVVSSSDYVYDNGILVARVNDDVDGHVGSEHPTSCKITTGSSVLYIDGRPCCKFDSEVDCAGQVKARAITLYVEP